MVACVTFQREMALLTSLSQKGVSSGLQEKASFVTRFSSRWTLYAFIVLSSSHFMFTLSYPYFPVTCNPNFTLGL